MERAERQAATFETRRLEEATVMPPPVLEREVHVFAARVQSSREKLSLAAALLVSVDPL